jgi:hypothetical protein
MQSRGGRRGTGAAALAVSVMAIIIAAGGVYYLTTTMGPHDSTRSYSEGTTEQPSTIQSSERWTSDSTTSSSSTTSSGTLSTATNSTTETSQASSSYTPIQISMFVNQTIMDRAQACYDSVECSSMIYIFNMTVRNTGTQEYHFNDLNLFLHTNGSTPYGVYPIVYAIQYPASGHQHEMPGVSIQPGGTIAGEEGFKVPSNEVPTELAYQDEYAGVNVTASTPPPTSWVSEVITFGAVSIAPPGLECSNVGNSNEPACFTATYTGMNSSILGSADYFTGERMGFTVTINLGAGSGSPGTVLVHSDVAGFAVTGITAPECTGGSGTCSTWVVDVYLVPQPGLSYYGTPALTAILQPA